MKYSELSLECADLIRNEEQEFEKFYFISMVSGNENDDDESETRLLTASFIFSINIFSAFHIIILNHIFFTHKI